MDNRKLLFLLLCIRFSFCADGTFITQRTQLIYQRFYLIKRLKQAQEMLRYCNAERRLLVQLDSTVFSHPDIESTVHKMQEELTLDPLAILWQKFVSYQYMYDPLFTDEYIKLLCSLYLLQEQYKTRTMPPTQEQQLSVLDMMVDRTDVLAINYRKIEDNPVGVDHIAKRYFVIKRLSKSMEFLTTIHLSDKKPFFRSITRTVTIDYTDEMQEDLEHFSHNRVRECLYTICREKNLDPLLRICAECKQYRYAGDDHFLQEMLKSIFLIYKSLLLKNMSGQTEQIILVEMNQVLETYENFDSLSLDEILEAIDVATDALLAVQSMQTSGTQRDTWLALSGTALCVLIGIQILHYFSLV